MQQNNPLVFEVDGKSLPISAFGFQHQIDALCARFSVETVGSGLTNFVGKKAVASFGGIERHFLVDSFEFVAPGKCKLSGRDEVSLIVDSSAQTLQFSGTRSFKSIAQKLCAPFGISVKGVDGGTVKDLTANPGESVFQVLEKVARKLGVRLTSKTGREITIELASQKPTAILNMESPLSAFEVKTDNSNRFGTYIVKGKSQGLFSDPIPDTVIKDSGADPRKTKVLVLQNTTSKEARTRAETEMRTRAQRAVSIKVVLPGLKAVRVGELAEVKAFGVKGKGVVKDLEYRCKVSEGETEESTTVTIGG